MIWKFFCKYFYYNIKVYVKIIKAYLPYGFYSLSFIHRHFCKKSSFLKGADVWKYLGKILLIKQIHKYVHKLTLFGIKWILLETQFKQKYYKRTFCVNLYFELFFKFSLFFIKVNADFFAFLYTINALFSKNISFIILKFIW